MREHASLKRGWVCRDVPPVSDLRRAEYTERHSYLIQRSVTASVGRVPAALEVQVFQQIAHEVHVPLCRAAGGVGYRENGIGFMTAVWGQQFHFDLIVCSLFDRTGDFLTFHRYLNHV